MTSLRKTTAISLLLIGILLCAAIVLAASAATVTHLSGPLVARTGTGVTKTLSIGSKVEQGDTIETAKRTYARVKFTDGSEVTLKPNTRFKVEQYVYDQAKPKEDAATYNLIKGGLRAVTAQIGKRGNQDAYRMKVPTATIGIRGTIFTVEYVEPEDKKAYGQPEPVQVASADTGIASDAIPLLFADAGNPPSPGNSGLFVYTWQGAVQVTNQAGTFPVPQNSGFQFAGANQPPVPIPQTRMPTFNPPAYFPPPGSSAPNTGTPQMGGPAAGGPTAGDGCIMR